MLNKRSLDTRQFRPLLSYKQPSNQMSTPKRRPGILRSLLYPTLLFYTVSTLALQLGSTRREKEAMQQQFNAQITTLNSVIERIQARDSTLDKLRELQLVGLRDRDGIKSVPKELGAIDWAAVFPGWARRKRQQLLNNTGTLLSIRHCAPSHSIRSRDPIRHIA